MKLTRSKLLETLRRKNEGWTSYQARKIAGISVRRVNQVWREYLETDEVPVIGKRVGRPRKLVTDEERELVRKTYEIYRVSASTLEPIIDRDHGVHIPHNTIHRILLELGYAKRARKQHVRKKKWIRYERRHSLTAVHIDWYEFFPMKHWVFAVIDDASRMALALLEKQRATTDASIDGMREALQYGRIKQCISDHGTQFTKGERGKSRFRKFLDTEGIKQILGRVKHPQTNGKVEKFFDLYQNHRLAFPSKQGFISWYNQTRPHRSLRFAELETPAQAFQRKLKVGG